MFRYEVLIRPGDIITTLFHSSDTRGVVNIREKL